MRVTTIYYVRHAQPDYSDHDDAARALTGKGMRDRALVTEFLMDKSVDAVFSSPYRRAVDTVGEFAGRAGLEIIETPDFRERKTDGVWVEDFDAFCRRQWSDFSYKLSDGESLGEVQERNIRALRRLLETCRGKTIVIGGHGTALCTILHHFNPAFGYEDFERVRPLMPWIVKFQFEGCELQAMEAIDLFSRP